MPILRNARRELYAQGLAAGLTQLKAAIQAGYSPKALGHASTVARRKDVKARVAELLRTKGVRLAQAMARRAGDPGEVKQALAIRTNGLLDRRQSINLTRENVAIEFARMGFATMRDYLRVQADGSPVVDFSDLNDDQWAAIREVVVETYIEGRGEDAVPVKRVRFKLHDKQAALMNLARVMGWVVERQEQVVRFEEKWAQMTPEQRSEDNRQLAGEIDRLLAGVRARRQAAENEEGITDVEPDEA